MRSTILKVVVICLLVAGSSVVESGPTGQSRSAPTTYSVTLRGGVSVGRYTRLLRQIGKLSDKDQSPGGIVDDDGLDDSISVFGREMLVSRTVLPGLIETFVKGEHMVNVFFVEGLNNAQVRRLNSARFVVDVDDQEDSYEIFDGFEQSNPPSWGIDRIDQESLPLDRSLKSCNDGKGTNVYVVDTGIQVDHPEFGSRASCFFNSFDPSSTPDCRDDNSHGTHVAGTAAGKDHGIARGANVLGVKVCTSGGRCPGYRVFNGLVQIAADPNPRRAIINLSIGFGTSVQLALQVLSLRGFVVVNAAGNSNTDVCSTPYGSVAGALTVGGTTVTDQKYRISSFGSCVDILAPAQFIRSSVPGGAYAFKSGTSMASPHVAGVVALYRELNPTMSSADTVAAIKETAVVGAISGFPPSTPNRLVNLDAASCSDACQSACDQCDFTFETQNCVDSFSSTGPPNRPFTGELQFKGQGVGTLVQGITNSNNMPAEFISEDGEVSEVQTVQDFPGQDFSKSAFKPFGFPPDFRFSGVGHENYQGAQREASKGRCVRVYFSSWQVLASRSGPVIENVNNVNKKTTNCVVFRTNA